MRFIIKLTIISFALAFVSINAKAKVKDNDPIYAFGYSTNLNDTTLFLTTVQPLPGAILSPKEGFLEYRNDYGNQLKSYLESIYPGYQCCAIFFSKKQKSLEKKRVKTRKNLLKVKRSKLIELSNEEFQFKALTE